MTYTLALGNIHSNCSTSRMQAFSYSDAPSSRRFSLGQASSREFLRPASIGRFRSPEELSYEHVVLTQDDAQTIADALSHGLAKPQIPVRAFPSL